eukprot:1956987-Pyramimonas_sp.AAC.1
MGAMVTRYVAPGAVVPPRPRRRPRSLMVLRSVRLRQRGAQSRALGAPGSLGDCGAVLELGAPAGLMGGGAGFLGARPPPL